jgi:hypothetical protein
MYIVFTECKTNEVKRKVTYDRTFLLKLRKSKFCKKRPDIPDIPEIMVNTDVCIICKITSKNNTAGATCRTGTAYPSGVLEFIPVFSGVHMHVARS